MPRTSRWARVGMAFAAITAVALLSVGCTPHAQIRTISVDDSGSPRHCGHADKEACAGGHSIEHHTYTTKGGLKGDYHLAFVEFDDQGWFWDRKQMEAVLNFFYESKNDEFLIFVFAHGWRHNSEPRDTNVICFQRLLERFAIMEREIAARPKQIVGVYIGWRGLSANVQPFEILSFWDRKNTAQRVGLGGVTEFLNRLNGFRKHKNRGRDNEKTQLIVAGHSFGGKVIYSALAHDLIRRATETEPGRNGEIAFDTATSFGDLVVLINPAFEGSLYESLHHAATNRCYGSEQRPVMLVVTSDADEATSGVFPLGRRIGNLFESTRSEGRGEQIDTIMNTVGHLDRYRTHRLTLAPNIASEKFEKNPIEGECPFLSSTAEFDIDNELGFLGLIRNAKNQMAAEKKNYLTLESFGERTIPYGDEIMLERNTDYVPNYPYLVVSTDKSIIPGHNDIYGERFTDFLRRFYLRHIGTHINYPPACYPTPPAKLPNCKENSAISPCQQSCQRDAAGTSCSDRRGVENPRAGG